MITRKGITQHFSADGLVQGDERWQIARLANGAAQLDAEVTRIAPFPEPRQESLGFILAPGAAQPLQTLSLALHESRGRREGRVNIVDNRAMFCWQTGRETHRAEKAWGDEDELEFNSPLFISALIWRCGLAPGHTRAYACARLDAITFEPGFTRKTLARLEDEERETRFGVMRLAHYTLRRMAHAAQGTHIWCDADGIVFDLVAEDGARQALTAVNFGA